MEQGEFDKIKNIDISCQYCGQKVEPSKDWNLKDVDEILYWNKKIGMAKHDCESCSKAIEGWQGRTDKCPTCVKLARYTVNEEFVECFGCGKTNE